jgi:hypothetical protein
VPKNWRLSALTMAIPAFERSASKYQPGSMSRATQLMSNDRSGFGPRWTTARHVVCGVPPSDVFVPGPVHPGGTPWASAGLVIAIDAAAITAGATVLSKKLRTFPLAPRRLPDIGPRRLP